jgi:uncharacterized protein YbjQ (UPF0145 family)
MMLMQPSKTRKLPLLWQQKRIILISLTLFLLAFSACFHWAGWQSVQLAKAETTAIQSIDETIAQAKNPTQGATVLNENGQPMVVPTQQTPDDLMDVARNWLEVVSNFGQLISLIVLATIGFICGTIAEKKHYTSIKRRELKFKQLPAVPIRLHHFLSEQQLLEVVETRLVTGCVVVSQDYFKMILANLKNFVGGSVSSYESLMDRARREAILRMKEQAPMADAIVNVRLESITMGKDEGDKKPICSIQVLAYGTAVTLQR